MADQDESSKQMAEGFRKMVGGAILMAVAYGVYKILLVPAGFTFHDQFR